MQSLARIALATLSTLALTAAAPNLVQAQSFGPGLWEMPYYQYEFCLDQTGTWKSLNQSGWTGYWSDLVRGEPGAMVGSTDPGVENDSIVITGTPGHYQAHWNEWNSNYSWIGLVDVRWEFLSTNCNDAWKYDRGNRGRRELPMQQN
jgi:hypothetical protein